MGVTIHHDLVLNKYCVKGALDRTENLAKSFKEQAKVIDIPFTIKREDDLALRIDIGECETLAFRFYTVRDLIKHKDEPVNGPKGWNDKAWKYECLTRDNQKLPYEGYEIDKYPQNELAYASGFCKTQFAKSILEHYYVAELIRSVASYCIKAEVSDEGDYYHTGNLEDATGAIVENGKLINSIGAMLQAKGFEGTQIIKGGETVIKSNRKAK